MNLGERCENIKDIYSTDCQVLLFISHRHWGTHHSHGGHLDLQEQ